MAVDGLLAADSDMHVMEPADLWQRYMDPRWGHAIPVGLEEIERDMRVRVKNEVMLRLGRMRPQAAGRAWKAEQDSSFVHAEAQRWDAASQVMAMEMEHLDSTVLFPSRGLFVLSMQSTEHIGPNGLEPELATAISQGYNDWMADFVADCERPGRVFGAAMLAPHDVGRAVDELARNVERGFVAAFLTPGLVDNLPWHDKKYDPLWAEAERLNVPVCFHGGGVCSLKPDFAFSEHLDKLMLWHPFNQPLGIMFVATCFTSGGILERFPTLRVGLLEGNCSWAPFMAYRLDEHWEWTGRFEAPDAAHEAVGVSRAQLLPLVRGGRDAGDPLLRRLRRRQRRVLDRLSPRRFEVSPCHQGLHGAPLRGQHQEEAVVGQLRQALQPARNHTNDSGGTLR